MIQTIKCPTCAAPLELIEGTVIETCVFCGSRIMVSSDNAHTESAASSNDKQKLDEILQIARAGNKIQAIKVFRETFGAGLKEAKDAVESLERGETLDNFHSKQSPFVGDKQKLDEILNMVRSGNKIQAIKIFRDSFGGGLKEAKDAVESLERGENFDPQTYKSGNNIQKAGTTGCAAISTIGMGLLMIIIGIAIYTIIAY